MIPLKTDCRHFRGDAPCKPHKQFGVHCIDEQGKDCLHYDMVDKKILIIKLGAVGDVIRTTPLLRKIKETSPRSKIYWLTLTPEVLPSQVDERLAFSLPNIVALRSIHFDALYNLDKDREACALASQISASEKRGFILKDGVIAPADEAAQPKYLTGIFDDVSRSNTRSYPQEIFEICGFAFGGEKYVLENKLNGSLKWKLDKRKKVVGLNTGCGGRWTSRLWEEKNWVALAKGLKKRGYEVLLLGGEQEHKKNQKLARASKAKYFGHFSLDRFIDLADQCDLVVTGVTMAMHITIGLGKKIVLLNNIFNKNEFEIYKQGVILEPSKPCQCFFQATCSNTQYRCMNYLAVNRVAQACTELCPPR